MAKYIMMALTNSKEGADSEFNRWYTELHVPDVLSNVAAVKTCTRFRLADSQMPGIPPSGWRYLALWEVETDDLAGFYAAMKTQPKVPASPTLDPPTTRVWIFSPITERMSPTIRED